MNNEKNVPELRFPGYTNKWNNIKISEVIKKGKSGGTPNTAVKEYYMGNIPFLSITDITNSNGHIYDTEKHITEEAISNCSAWLVPKGSISLAMYASVGKVAVLERSLATSQAFFNMVIDKTETRDYVFQYLKKKEALNEWKSQISTGTQPNLNAGKINNTYICIPDSIEEQGKIGEFFSELDTMLDSCQQKLDSLKEFKKGMLQRCFPQEGQTVPEFRFPGFTDAWKQRKLGELGEILTGSTPSTSHKEYYSDNGIPWVTPTDISENIIYDTPRKLSDKGQEIARIAPKGTILVTCIASIGKNTMLGTMGSFNQQINALIPNFEKNNPYFLLTESMLWSEKMKQQAAAGTMQIVNKTEFSELVTMIPNLEEQEAIGSYFRNLDNLITLHQRKCDELRELKKGFLQRMFV